MILFLGDSFTWGQGLYFEEWYDNGVSADFINKHLPPNYPQELMNYEDDEIRKKYHFPNLISKELNTQYVTKWGNGGSNYDIINMLENVTYQMIPDGIELVVVQFTDFMRDAEFIIDDLEKKLGPDLNNVNYVMMEQINKIDNFCNYPTWHFGDSFQKLPWIGFSWRDDVGRALEKYYPDNFIPLEYNGKSYHGFIELYQEDIFLHNSILGCKDEHFNKKGHRFISNCILNKIEKMDIQFNKREFFQKSNFNKYY